MASTTANYAQANDISLRQYQKVLAPSRRIIEPTEIEGGKGKRLLTTGFKYPFFQRSIFPVQSMGIDRLTNVEAPSGLSYMYIPLLLILGSN